MIVVVVVWRREEGSVEWLVCGCKSKRWRDGRGGEQEREMAERREPGRELGFLGSHGMELSLG